MIRISDVLQPVSRRDKLRVRLLRRRTTDIDLRPWLAPPRSRRARWRGRRV